MPFEVVDCVIPSKESVAFKKKIRVCHFVSVGLHTNNPDTATVWEIDIKAREGRYASALHLKGVICCLQWVWLAIERECEVWEAGNLGAIDSVLTIP